MIILNKNRLVLQSKSFVLLLYLYFLQMKATSETDCTSSLFSCFSYHHQIFWILFFFLSPTLYSYLSASIGFKEAALRAGYHPKKTPTEAENRNPSTTDHHVTAAGRLINLDTAHATINPRTVPIIPPVTESEIASMRNWEWISLSWHQLLYGFQFLLYVLQQIQA